jgi:hypothetical protein
LDPVSIKDGLSLLIQNAEFYKDKSAALKTKRVSRWQGQAELLKVAVAI